MTCIINQHKQTDDYKQQAENTISVNGLENSAGQKHLVQLSNENARNNYIDLE